MKASAVMAEAMVMASVEAVRAAAARVVAAAVAVAEEARAATARVGATEEVKEEAARRRATSTGTRTSQRFLVSGRTLLNSTRTPPGRARVNLNTSQTRSQFVKGGHSPCASTSSPTLATGSCTHHLKQCTHNSNPLDSPALPQGRELRARRGHQIHRAEAAAAHRQGRPTGWRGVDQEDEGGVHGAHRLPEGEQGGG